MKWLVGLAALLVATVIACVLWIGRTPPGLDEVAAHAYVAPEVPAGAPTLTATWYGTAAVLLSDGEQAVFVDPFITRPEGWRAMLTNRQIAPDEKKIAQVLMGAGLNRQKLQAVAVSHSHHDHAMDAGVVSRLTRAWLVGSESTASIGRGASVPEFLISVPIPGRPITLGRFTLTYFESRHGGATGGAPTGNITAPLQTPARYLDYKQGGTYSILVEHALGKVLLHGSSGFLPEMLKGRRADVVFLGIAFAGDYENYLKETVDAVGATRVIPTHWDDFTRALDEPLKANPVGVDLPEFFETMARLRPQVKVQTLTMGQPAALFVGVPPPPEPAPRRKKSRR